MKLGEETVCVSLQALHYSAQQCITVEAVSHCTTQQCITVEAGSHCTTQQCTTVEAGSPCMVLINIVTILGNALHSKLS